MYTLAEGGGGGGAEWGRPVGLPWGGKVRTFSRDP